MIWYAVLRDLWDDDWGYGSHDLREAEKMVRGFKADGYEDPYIAMIAEGDNPVCIGEFHY